MKFRQLLNLGDVEAENGPYFIIGSFVTATLLSAALLLGSVGFLEGPKERQAVLAESQSHLEQYISQGDERMIYSSLSAADGIRQSVLIARSADSTLTFNAARWFAVFMGGCALLSMCGGANVAMYQIKREAPEVAKTSVYRHAYPLLRFGTWGASFLAAGFVVWSSWTLGYPIGMSLIGKIFG